MAIWQNLDGLTVKFTASDFAKYGGEYSTLGTDHIWEWNLRLENFPAGTYILSDGIRIPKGFELVRAEVYVDDAAAGGTSVAFGLYNMDRTAFDDDGLVTAANGATGSLTNGATVVGTGSQISTKTAATYLVNMIVAGTYTDGDIKFRIIGHPSTDV